MIEAIEHIIRVCEKLEEREIPEELMNRVAAASKILDIILAKTDKDGNNKNID